MPRSLNVSGSTCGWRKRRHAGAVPTEPQAINDPWDQETPPLTPDFLSIVKAYLSGLHTQSMPRSRNYSGLRPAESSGALSSYILLHTLRPRTGRVDAVHVQYLPQVLRAPEPSPPVGGALVLLAVFSRAVHFPALAHKATGTAILWTSAFMIHGSSCLRMILAAIFRVTSE